MDLDIFSINLDRRVVVTWDGSILPITAFFDAYGDETEDPEEACRFIAGPSADGFLVHGRVRDFDRMRLH